MLGRRFSTAPVVGLFVVGVFAVCVRDTEFAITRIRQRLAKRLTIFFRHAIELFPRKNVDGAELAPPTAQVSFGRYPLQFQKSRLLWWHIFGCRSFHPWSSTPNIVGAATARGSLRNVDALSVLTTGKATAGVDGSWRSEQNDTTGKHQRKSGGVE